MATIRGGSGEAASAEEWEAMVLVGVVARSHGNKGQVIVNSHSHFPELRFRGGATLFARLGSEAVQKVEITTVRFQQGRPVLGLAGVGTIDEADRLAGAELRIPELEQEALPEGTYYHHQLIGCEVVTDDGVLVGRVTRVDGEGQTSRLVVLGRGAELLIPLAAEICQVDVRDRRVTVTPPRGLLELNGEWRDLEEPATGASGA